MHNNLVPRMKNPRGFDAYEKMGICHMSNWEQGQNVHHKESAKNGHNPSRTVFDLKFRNVVPNNLAMAKNMSSIQYSIYSGRLPTTMLYPYFEKDIPNRKEKNYVN